MLYNYGLLMVVTAEYSFQLAGTYQVTITQALPTRVIYNCH